jgi:3-hydroxybutyryl-CoA dehydrogenase
MTARHVQHVTVIGLGTMGHGIAQSFATAGCIVTGYDDNPAARGSLVDRVRANLFEFARAGLIVEAEIDPILGRVSVLDSEAEALREAEFVTEAIVEDLATKQELFARLENTVAETTILASNSSTFPISQSGALLRHPERAIVTHWFNPPHIVPTVEVVGSPQTSEETIETALALLRRAGKLAIRINQELPGFLVNRVQIAVQREVWDLLDRGVASAEDIDAAIRGSMGFRLAALGPLMIHDFGGLDIQTAVYRNLAPEIASGTDIPEAVQHTVDAGNFGYKTGRGFYHYPLETAESVRSERDQRYLKLLKLFYNEQNSAD